MSEIVESEKLETVQSDRASSLALITSDGNMRNVMSMAALMSNSKVTVPKHLQGNEGDCAAIIIQATNWGMNPFAVAQKTHLVNGVLGYEAQLVNAVVQQSNAITGAFSYEFDGEGQSMRCRCGAVIKGQKEITWGEWLKAADVTTKNSPLWKTNPKQQMAYLQVKNWARLYAPGAILGVYTDDELNDIPPKDITSEVEVAKQELPLCSEENFNKNIDKWRELIETGKKTTESLIASLQTKASFTDSQLATIKSWKKVEIVENTASQVNDDFVTQMEQAEQAVA